MKVLFIAHSGGIEGSGVALLNLLKSLKDKVQCTVVLPTHGILEQRLSAIGIKTIVIPKYQNFIVPRLDSTYDKIAFVPRFGNLLFQNARAKKHLRKIVESEKPDIIHSNSSVIPFGVDIAKEKGIPHVWHLREYLNEKYQYRFFYIFGYRYFTQRLLSANNHSIAITDATYDYFQLKDKKDKRIYDGVFSEKENGVVPSKQEKYFLFAGALTQGKGVFDAIDAFAAIADKYSDIKLYLAGKYYPDVEKYIENLQCKNRITLLGFRDDVYELMSNAYALLVPSYHEGFGFIVAEAMLNRCPVIGRDVAGVKEQFDNGLKLCNREIGFRFNTLEELKLIMEKTLEMNEAELSTMKEDAYRTVKELYTSERYADEVYDFYNSILSN